MDPIILIGIDLAATAVFLVLALLFVRSRIRHALENRALDPDHEAWSKTADESRAAESNGRGQTDTGVLRREAERLRRQGVSVDAIAQRLQTSSGEIEMLLTLSEMGRKGKFAGRNASLFQAANGREAPAMS